MSYILFNIREYINGNPKNNFQIVLKELFNEDYVLPCDICGAFITSMNLCFSNSTGEKYGYCISNDSCYHCFKSICTSCMSQCKMRICKTYFCKNCGINCLSCKRCFCISCIRERSLRYDLEIIKIICCGKRYEIK